MKTETILKAIAALKEANRALYNGTPSEVSAQMQIGRDCWSAGYELQRELLADVPEIKVAA